MPEETRIQCIKLFLDKIPKFPLYVSEQDIQAQLDKHGRSVEDVIADYLTQLLKHAEKEMRDTYYDSMLKGTKRRYVLTVPAVWTDTAKRITRNAAARAGAVGDKVVMVTGMLQVQEPDFRRTVSGHELNIYARTNLFF